MLNRWTMEEQDKWREIRWTVKSADAWVKANIHPYARVTKVESVTPVVVMRCGFQHTAHRRVTRYHFQIFTNNASNTQHPMYREVRSAFRLGNLMTSVRCFVAHKMGLVESLNRAGETR